jgi:hypothetical protein
MIKKTEKKEEKVDSHQADDEQTKEDPSTKEIN